jgi:phospholipid/cholesterol/gamma-HCH transport system substrate-binding protein
MLDTDPRRRLKVGLFTAALIALCGAAVFMLGRKQGLLVRHVSYQARFTDVGGLAAGAPVHLNGVVVGAVDDIVLPSDPAERQITVDFWVEARVARRIRADSRARIRSLGLLGDRFLDVSSGDPGQPPLPPGAEVPSQEPTDVAAVLARGGDAVTNVLAISASLRRILERVERGEGILGELTTSPESGHKVVARLGSVLDQTDELLKEIRQGHGTLSRLINDPKLADALLDDLAAFAHAGRRLTEALDRDLGRNDSVVAGLLRDPQGRERLQRALDEIGNAAAAAAAAGKNLAEGRGTLGHLINDEAYAQGFLDDLAALTRSLRNIADKIDRGTGTAGKMVNDPELFDDLENVVRGIQQSSLARWYLRNRRAAGERASTTPTPASARRE